MGDALFHPVKDGHMAVEIEVPIYNRDGDRGILRPKIQFTKKAWDNFVKTGNEVFDQYAKEHPGFREMQEETDAG